MRRLSEDFCSHIHEGFKIGVGKCTKQLDLNFGE